MTDPIEEASRWRPQRVWSRFRHGLSKWIPVVAMVSGIVTPWVIYWLNHRR